MSSSENPTNTSAKESTEEVIDQYPGIVHWLGPEYASDTNPSKWGLQAMNLAALPSPCAHPTLLFYIFGECATHISKLIKTTPSSAIDTVLTAFFQPYFSRLPNYSEQDDKCKPTGVLASNWTGDGLAGYGSYCNFQVGVEEGDKDIECMRKGMPERHVWLAGEHTAPFIALGTTTGAYMSGEAVAMKIARTYETSDDETVDRANAER